MPSIKEQARRLIKSACQVIAVVMDTFTDVDIFADLLDAARRHVPVYILLDEQDSYHFVSMVLNCKVNLDSIPMMRVRTVAGITYYSRTGKSFKGQVKDRFLLTDCRAVLSGNYSFMWSYEKIHRCIAHLFLGELVTSFDEEFRILYAQSEPLVIDPSGALAIVDNHGSNNSYGSQFGLKRTQSLRTPLGYRRPHEITSTLPFGDPERNRALPFRRNDPFRQTIEPVSGLMIGKYSQQQFRVQQSYLEQGRSIVSRQMELSSSAYKRHSYAEGTQESYASSRQYMKCRVMNNLDETDFQRDQTQSSLYYNEDPVSGLGHGQYDRHRGLPPHLTTDQYSESSFRSDPEPLPGSYGRDYFSSQDLGGPEGHRGPPLAGRYGGGSSHKRPSIGQTYACQSSPTQPHSPEKKQFLKECDQGNDQDADLRHGLRNWRIHSYLSTYEDSGDEGLPQPMGPDAFEDPPVSQPVNTTDNSGLNFVVNEPPTVPPKPRPDVLRPRFGKPVLSENKSRNSSSNNHGCASNRRSRLRSSLIFSSSKAEMHNSGLGLKPASEEDEQLDSVRTSSIVAQILEKRRVREPFEWRKRAEEKNKEHVQEKDGKKEKEPQREKNEAQFKDENKTKEEPQKTRTESQSTLEKPEDTTPSSLSKTDSTPQQYIKDLIAKRKASKMEAESLMKAPEPAEKKPDMTNKPLLKSGVTPSTPSVSSPSGDTEPKKVDVSAKLSDLAQRHSVSSSKPPMTTPKPSASYLKPVETTQPSKEETSSEGQKKDIFKSLKPLSSPKIFKKAPLKLKALHPRHVSCGEEILTTDATDAEKSELKKNRTQSSSTLPRDDYKEAHKMMGSNTSINTLGEGKAEGKKHWLKGILGSKDKDKKSSADDKARNIVIEVTDETGKSQGPSAKEAGSTITDQTTTSNKTSMGVSGTSRYQSATSSIIFSSNLRDDTKVILEQISAHGQKNRADLAETAEDRGGDSVGKAFERNNSMKVSRFLRPQGNIQEREGLLKRIESLRKEKKVYSRFEVVCCSNEYLKSVKAVTFGIKMT
ncbi:hypothetical protein fugu_018170 [Takifugu bimaculatus]|uniref:Scaffolding anchor of CK1 domain-containing protein n=1 Tax=Takifugu bimaculatus TaxID=433685 RepID=A0A4Z2BM51_9TELE|nr:hypothetical protein fugu_018170 [Takifugu bimaculatus]